MFRVQATLCPREPDLHHLVGHLLCSYFLSSYPLSFRARTMLNQLSFTQSTIVATRYMFVVPWHLPPVHFCRSLPMCKVSQHSDAHQFFTDDSKSESKSAFDPFPQILPGVPVFIHVRLFLSQSCVAYQQPFTPFTHCRWEGMLYIQTLYQLSHLLIILKIVVIPILYCLIFTHIYIYVTTVASVFFSPGCLPMS